MSPVTQLRIGRSHLDRGRTLDILIKAVTPLRPLDFSNVLVQRPEGVTITLQGLEAGLEFSANRSGIRISLQ